MEPRIQYARTSDGVSIAYWTLGEGGTLVVTPWDVSHAQLWWQVPEIRRLYERLAEGRRLVGFDRRGSGLSDRDVSDHSPDAFLLDLESVVDNLELKSFALMGVWWLGLAAIAFAARHPTQVSHLILVVSAPKASDLLGTPAFQALRPLLSSDWALATETLGFYVYELAEGQAAQHHAAYLRECATQQAYQAMVERWEGYDVSEFLAQVKSPTLVMHPRRNRFAPTDAARQLASGIPNARLLVPEAPSGSSSDVWESVVAAINEFLDEGEEAEDKVDLPTGMTAILFTDIVDSTALTERLGDAVFREKARTLDASLRTIIRDGSGTPIEGKLLGDGVLATFASASQAIEAALQCGAAGDECGLALHLGIHAGDVIREQNNVYGGAVNIAARIAGASAPGEVLVSQTVRDLARTSAGVSFEDRGRKTLKGVEGRQRLFAVREESGD